MGEKLILEVLIPTYNRSDSAINAVNSVLECDDSRIAVFCHSNGIDKKLDAEFACRKRLRYGYFSSNRGAIENFRKLIEESNAEYILFLSDEDVIDIKLIDDYLEFISRNKFSFVQCGVVECSGENYLPLRSLNGESLNINELLSLFPIDPTYLSGFCFRRDLLTAELLDNAFQKSEANVYPHVLLRNYVTACQDIGIYGKNFIIKGEDAKVGGDSHSHIKQILTSDGEKLRLPRLNPKIYGTRARVAQFFFNIEKLQPLLKEMGFVRSSFFKFYISCAWLNIVNDAFKCTGETPGEFDEELRKFFKEVGPDTMEWNCAFFTAVISIRLLVVRSMVIKSVWILAKLFKLCFFVQKFGISASLRFVQQKN